MNGKIRSFIGVFLIILGLLLIPLSNRFLFRTTINNIDVFFLTPSQAKEKIINEYDNKIIEIGVQKIRVKDIIEEEIDFNSLKKDNGLGYSLDIKLKDNFIDVINKDRTISFQHGEIKKENNKIVVTEEKTGNKINEYLIKEDLERLLKENSHSKLEEEAYIEKPIAKEGYIETYNKIKELEKYSLNVNFKNINESLNWDTVQEFYNISEDPYSISIDRDRVLNYVKQLDKKYRTLGNSIEYTNIFGENMKLPNNQYGWDLLWEGSTDAIIEAIESNSLNVNLIIDKDNEFSPTKNRVEINLQEQKMYLIVNGELYFETHIVSGKPSTPTRRRVFSIYSKETNRILRGRNSDGSRYAAPVKYWMPFDGGIGIHDISSRPQSHYGNPSLHNWAGSHGCINTPDSAIKTFFDNLKVGDNVIVY